MTASVCHLLFIINDGPYGSERPYNAFRLILETLKCTEAELRVFLLGDGVMCAKRGQTPPPGYYNVAHMVKGVAGRAQVAT